jgi:hypothetical protein
MPSAHVFLGGLGPAAARKAARLAERKAHERCPRRTGHLDATIGATIDEGQSGRIDLYAGADYASFVNSGTRHMAARRFLDLAAKDARRRHGGDVLAAETVTAPGGGEQTFVVDRPLKKDEEVVVVDPRKLDPAWELDRGFYVGPGGEGGIGGRYEGFGTWLRTHPGTPVEMPRASFNLAAKVRRRYAAHPRAWQVGVDDGRHRLAWLRDRGYPYVPIVVPKAQADDFRARFGSGRIPKRGGG